MSIAVQYSIVAVIVLGALVFLCVLSYKKRKNNKPCSGCALTNTCNDPRNRNNRKTISSHSNETSSTARNSQCSAMQYKRREQERQ